VVKPLVLAVSLALLSPAAPESVTLSADREVVTYGDPVHLSVVVEPPAERVSVVGLPYDGGVYPAEPVPDGSGRWSVEDRPLISTQYRARAESVDSAEAPVVEVRPRVHLVVISARRGLFYTRAEALRSYRGRRAWLQRRTSRGWRAVERVRLGSRSAVRFFASLPDGRSRVRIVVEEAPGYVRGISRIAVIRH
jgi:hypothetical protein